MLAGYVCYGFKLAFLSDFCDFSKPLTAKVVILAAAFLPSFTKSQGAVK